MFRLLQKPGPATQSMTSKILSRAQILHICFSSNKNYHYKGSGRGKGNTISFFIPYGIPKHFLSPNAQEEMAIPSFCTPSPRASASH